MRSVATTSTGSQSPMAPDSHVEKPSCPHADHPCARPLSGRFASSFPHAHPDRSLTRPGRKKLSSDRSGENRHDSDGVVGVQAALQNRRGSEPDQHQDGEIVDVRFREPQSSPASAPPESGREARRPRERPGGTAQPDQPPPTAGDRVHANPRTGSRRPRSIGARPGRTPALPRTAAAEHRGRTSATAEVHVVSVRPRQERRSRR